jgi:hypothetical protein
MLDTGATGVFLFETKGLDVQIQARAARRVSTSSGVRIARAGILRRLVIGHESFEEVPVTLVQKSGLQDRVDGLVPGTLFDSIYFDHENGFVILNPSYRKFSTSMMWDPAASDRTKTIHAKRGFLLTQRGESIPPAPSGETISYGPKRVPALRAMSRH